MQTILQQKTIFNYLCMSLSKNELIERIIKTCNEKGISSSLISKHTTLSEPGIKKILEGETKNPRPQTLNIILDFVESYDIRKISSPIFLQEPSETYKTESLEDIIANKVIEKLKPLIEKIKKND